MKLTKKVLKEEHIFNPHNLARIAESKLYIGYSPGDYGRASHSASWDIVGITFKTDPTGAWYNHGHKTFSIWRREDKALKLEEAMQWVKENYGITEWERDVFGSYQVKGALDRIVARIDSRDNKRG